MSFFDTIEISSNVFIEARDRGKLVPSCCRDGHNIWTYTGREWVTKVMSYAVAGPPTTAEDNRVAFMGFGVGGNRQTTLPIGGAIDTDYPGTNLQDDSNPDITYLERPVRIDDGAPVGDYWLRQLTWADTLWGDPLPATSRYVQYFADFTALEFNQASGASFTYPNVPISEIALFHYGWLGNPGEYDTLGNVYPAPGARPIPLAYHTFYSISKTTDIELRVRWEVRVGG